VHRGKPRHMVRCHRACWIASLLGLKGGMDRVGTGFATYHWKQENRGLVGDSHVSKSSGAPGHTALGPFNLAACATFPQRHSWSVRSHALMGHAWMGHAYMGACIVSDTVLRRHPPTVDHDNHLLQCRAVSKRAAIAPTRTNKNKKVTQQHTGHRHFFNNTTTRLSSFFRPSRRGVLAF
jgi:hypothetical protein